VHCLRNSAAELVTCVQCIKVICTEIDAVVESRLATVKLVDWGKIGGLLPWLFVSPSYQMCFLHKIIGIRLALKVIDRALTVIDKVVD